MATAERQAHPARSGRPVFITVPWERALAIRESLLERGIPSIARFDPAGRKAKLEILQDVNPDRLQDVLAGNRA